MKFIITVDTEGDNQWSLPHRYKVTTENAKYLPPFQNLCEEYGYKPTYLTSYEMACDEYFVAFGKELLRKGTAEIGCHPHSWTTPPDYDLTGDDRRYMPYMIEYPAEIIFKKVKFLTDLLANQFETEIHTHRSGRWGMDSTYAHILYDLKFQLDCSVTPGISWKPWKGNPNGKGGPDFTNFPTDAYFLRLDDISRPGFSSLLEVPVTGKQRYGPLLNAIYGSSNSIVLKRLMWKLFGTPAQWFRFYKGHQNDLFELLEQHLAGYSAYIQFIIHSSELMPAGCPHFSTKDDVDNLYKNLRAIFSLLSTRGVEEATCAEFYKSFTTARASAGTVEAS